MQRTENKRKFIRKNWPDVQGSLLFGFKVDGQINLMRLQPLQVSGRVPGLNGNVAVRKAFPELAQHGRQNVLACGTAGPDPHSAAAPAPQAPELRPRNLHLREDLFRLSKKLLSRLRQQHGFSHPVKKTTRHIPLQSLDAVAHSGLGQIQLMRSPGKTQSSGEHHKSPELPAVERFAHA